MFRDREDAGRQLAERLREFPLTDPLVLGLPRGGMIVAAAIAHELGAELDVLLARKLRAPWQRELAVGIVAETGEVFFSEHADNVQGLSPEYLEEECRFQRREMARRRAIFRAVRKPAEIGGRSVIVTDDGIATGSTLIGALEMLAEHQPHELIAAVPFASGCHLDLIASRCDHFICSYFPRVHYSAGQFYEHFDQVSDEDVIEVLRRAQDQSYSPA